MSTTRHNPAGVPEPIGGYSHGITCTTPGRLLFISGQIPEDEAGHAPCDFREQCHLVWHHILAILQSADMTVAHLIKVTTFLTDRRQMEINGEVRREYLGEYQPALTVIVAQTLQSEWFLEIEAVAFRAVP